MTARRGRRIAVVTLALIVLLGAGDQGLRALAEHRLARQTTCQLDAVNSTVAIGGAFLTPQIIRRQLTHLTVHSQGVRETGGPVDITANLYDVRQLGHNRLSAGHGQITVTVPFSTVASGAGKGITASVSGGELTFTATSGKAASSGATVFAHVALDHDALVVTPIRVLVAGVPVSWAEAKRSAADYGQSLAPHRVTLPSTLTSLGLTSATVSPAGLLLQASGPHLDLVLPDVPSCH